jgi:hypothetical protein
MIRDITANIAAMIVRRMEWVIKTDKKTAFNMQVIARKLKEEITLFYQLTYLKSELDIPKTVDEEQSNNMLKFFKLIMVSSAWLMLIKLIVFKNDDLAYLALPSDQDSMACHAFEKMNMLYLLTVFTDLYFVDNRNFSRNESYNRSEKVYRRLSFIPSDNGSGPSNAPFIKLFNEYKQYLMSDDKTSVIEKLKTYAFTFFGKRIINGEPALIKTEQECEEIFNGIPILKRAISDRKKKKKDTMDVSKISQI